MKITASVKLDKDTKIEAQKLAKELGLSLSTVINSQLKQFVRDKEIVLSQAPRMSAYLENIIEEIQDDLKTGNNFDGPFNTPGEIEKYFASL